jgi:phosphoribosylaminoimidazole-succinocarboxamide synthase
MDPVEASLAVHNLLRAVCRMAGAGGRVVSTGFDEAGQPGSGTYARLSMQGRSLACAGDVDRYELAGPDWSADVVVAQAAGTALSLRVDIKGFNESAERFLAAWLQPPTALSFGFSQQADLSEMVDTTKLTAYYDNVLRDATIPELPAHYRGKVRDNYDLPDGRRVIVATDRLSAFDRILTAIPLKGQVLTQTARYWFDATRDICPNHVLEYPDPNVLVCRRLDILPVEVVVRDYLAGTTDTSILSMYKKGQREMYGIRLPDGMRENQKLPETIITPTSKAFDAGHDEPLTPDEIVGRRLLTAQQWQTVSKAALALFARGRELAAKQGLILVDTKYEFGVDDSGRIVLADEIHTPDSSRYWFQESYQQKFEAGQRPQSFDKDVVRTWVAARCDPYKEAVPEIPRDIVLDTSRVYISAFEQITGQPFPLPDPKVPVLERIRANLAPYFPKAG